MAHEGFVLRSEGAFQGGDDGRGRVEATREHHRKLEQDAARRPAARASADAAEAPRRLVGDALEGVRTSRFVPG